MEAPQLTKAGRVKKIKKIVKRQKMIKPARVKDIDTGVKQIIEIRENGPRGNITRKEERPVMIVTGKQFSLSSSLFRLL